MEEEIQTEIAPLKTFIINTWPGLAFDLYFDSRARGQHGILLLGLWAL